MKRLAAYSDLDGISLMPAIRGDPLPDRGGPLFGYRAYEDLYASVRDGDWKMLAYRSGKVSLYNIDQDEAEQNDVSDSNPAIVKRLTDELVRCSSHCGQHGPTPSSPMETHEVQLPNQA